MKTLMIIFTIAGLFLTAVGIIVGAGGFQHAEIIKIVSSFTDSQCPDTLYNFKLAFKNSGSKSTSLCVNVDSEEVQFKDKSKCYFSSVGETNDFYFYVNTSSLMREYSLPANATIIYSYDYDTKGFFRYQAKSPDLSCNYIKEKYSNSFNLVQ